MGNLSSIPSLVGENIMSYLDPCEAEKLMAIDPQLEEFITNNGPFWRRKAKFLNFTEPIAFVRLRDPELFEPDILIKHTIEAYHHYREGLERFYSKGGKETVYEIDDDQIENLAVDEKNGNVAVHLSYTGIRIYSIARFGEPPFKIIPKASHYIMEVVLRGNVLYTRPTPTPEINHTRPFNWRTDDELPLLDPAFSTTRKFPLRASEQMILTYDFKSHTIFAYNVHADGWDGPLRQPLSQDEKIVDLAAYGGLSLMIYSQGHNYYYRAFDIGRQQVMRSFVIPPDFPHSMAIPHIHYPYIFIYEKGWEERLDWFRGRRPKLLFLACVNILAQIPRMEYHEGVWVHGVAENPTCQTPLFFIKIDEEFKLGVYSYEQLRPIFRYRRHQALLPLHETYDSYDYASVGMSYFAVRDTNEIVYKQFCLNGEICL